MKNTFFFNFGKFIYHHRKSIVIVWTAVLLGCFPFISDIITPFKSTGFVDYTSQSAQAEDFLSKNLTYSQNRLLLIYTSKDLKTTNPLFLSRIKDSLKN